MAFEDGFSRTGATLADIMLVNRNIRMLTEIVESVIKDTEEFENRCDKLQKDVESMSTGTHDDKKTDRRNQCAPGNIDGASRSCEGIQGSEARKEAGAGEAGASIGEGGTTVYDNCCGYSDLTEAARNLCDIARESRVNSRIVFHSYGYLVELRRWPLV